MKIAILALQGAFAEHQQMLLSLGVESFLIRNLDDWKKEKDGLIIPGGESTAMMRIMRDEKLTDLIRQELLNGLPVFGTCAGMILLDDKHLCVMDITAKRNAYGRQLGSFHTEHEFKELGKVPMTFIRAPYIERIGEGVEVFSTLDDHVIAARQNNMLVTSFHPELDNNPSIHKYFFEIVTKSKIANID